MTSKKLGHPRHRGTLLRHHLTCDGDFGELKIPIKIQQYETKEGT